MSTDRLGGLLILISIALGIAEYYWKDGNIVFLDLLPYAIWLIIGLVISYAGECENEEA